MDQTLDLSIIIPSYNEKESLPELLTWIRQVMERDGLSYEAIIVDDGSDDGSWDCVKALSEKDASVKGIRFRRNYGKSAALFCGFRKAAGDIVVTMDADLQDSPEEIPEMRRMILEEGYDLVSGWKQHRQDNKLTKNLPSKLYNATARMITGIKLHDMNCGLKAYRKEVVKNIEVYGEMHRYIPYLAKNAGFANIGEKPVHHQKRKYGKSKFGMNRFVNGFLDLISLSFLQTFGKKPMHFFGYPGILMFLIGGIMAVWIIIAKLVHQANHMSYRAVTDQPLFYLALVAVILGVLLFLAGFVCEMISRTSSGRNNYNISDEI
ncbi:MAG: glycosyltransferase family 2 protein [Bacteroidales bacterium]|nr:glycosyltransferase family 2 protein [Bacteroidales bacterium]MBR4228987.1 glycosyltransferase family 2 protein [Bacteroidales bacterium]